MKNRRTILSPEDIKACRWGLREEFFALAKFAFVVNGKKHPLVPNKKMGRGRRKGKGKV